MVADRIVPVTNSLRAAVLVTLLTPCCGGRALRYDDDLDLDALKTSFKCEGGPHAGDRGHACRILDDFKDGDTFDEWPKKGLESWFGRKVCTDSIDASDHVDFGRVHLNVGVGKASFPDDVKVDPSRDVPYGAQFIAESASGKSPELIRGDREAVDAAMAGTTPHFAGFSDMDRASLEAFWEEQKTPPGTPDFFRLVRSRSKSILGGPLTDDAGKKLPSATYYLRVKGKRMLVVYPAWGTTTVPCVAELNKIYTAP